MRVVEVIIDVCPSLLLFKTLLILFAGLQIVRCANSDFGMVNNGNESHPKSRADIR